MEPMTLFGTIIGVFMNKTFPDWLLMIFLVVLLGFTSFKTIRKGLEIRRLEMLNMYKGAPLISNKKFLVNQLEGEEEFVDGLDKLMHKEARSPRFNILLLVTAWLGLLIIFLLIGSTDNELSSIVGIKACSWEYWVILSLSFPWLGGITAIAVMKLRKKHADKISLGYNFMEGDVKWNNNTSVVIALLSVIAGAFAGMLGVGGGLVKGPLMLELGILPQVAAATSAFMITFTSSSAVIQYLFMGLIPWTFGVWYFIFGVIASFIGQTGLDYIIRRYQKVSYITFLIGFVTLLSTAGLVLVGIIKIVNAQEQLSFRSLCSVST